jgi:hypothetical protein
MRFGFYIAALALCGGCAKCGGDQATPAPDSAVSAEPVEDAASSDAGRVFRPKPFRVSPHHPAPQMSALPPDSVPGR